MRRGYKVLLGCGIAIGIIGIAGGIALFVISRDEAPPDDSDLIVKRLDIPDDQNGFTYFQQAGEILYWPGTESWEKAHTVADDPNENSRDRLDKMLDGKDWDEALAAEILDANKPTFALIEKGLACREFQVPEGKSIYDKIPYVFDFMQTARLMRLRAADLAARDKGVEAVERTLDVVFFGNSQERSKGGLVHFLVGQTIKGEGLEQLRRLLVECKVPAETLQAVAVRLTAWQDSATGLADGLRCEYQIESNTIEAIHQGNLTMKSLARIDHDPIRPSWSERLDVALSLKPNQTKRLCAESLRTFVEACAKPYAACPTLHSTQENRDRLLRTLAPRNTLGRTLYGILVPAVLGVLEHKCGAHTDMAATQALMALKPFKMKTGRLPKTLDELVLEYLAAVPLDDFDGKPLRYSPEKKILYSVGKDLKDVGGFTKEETLKWWQKENPTRPPEDAPPAPPVWDLPNPSWPIEF